VNLKAWSQLLRLPNLFTVPGDPLAGFSLACAASQGLDCWISFQPYGVSLASLLFYCSGLLQNDYFDRQEDFRDRPYRPIPSGRVQPGTVILVSSLFALAGTITAFSLGTATGFTALVLMAVITLYNRWAKRIQVAGPLTMGLCRGLSLLLGASAFGGQAMVTPGVVVSAIALTLFIAAVTHIAAGETAAYTSGEMRWAPLATVVAWFIGLHLILKPSALFSLLIFVALSAAAAFWTFRCGSFLTSNAPPPVIQKTIGQFIRGLLLIQATMIALSGPSTGALVVILLLALPLSQAVAKRFYAS
jgi:4-hydroxybenzoate polyprenyltransferase